MNIDEAMKKSEKESCFAHMNMILDNAATGKETSKARMAFSKCFVRLMEMGVSVSDIIKGIAESSTKAEAAPSMPLLTLIGTLAEFGKVYGNRRIKGVEIRPDNTVFIDAVE